MTVLLSLLNKLGKKVYCTLLKPTISFVSSFTSSEDCVRTLEIINVSSSVISTVTSLFSLLFNLFAIPFVFKIVSGIIFHLSAIGAPGESLL